MRYKILGRSGLKVSEICLGTMTFGEDWGWGGSKEESRKMFDAFINAGDNFIDTANNYTNGTAETLVGEFIHPGRGKYVIATKYTLSTNPKDPNSGGNHKKSLVQSLERSLKRPITISLGFTNEPIYSPFVKMLMFSEIGEKIDLLK